MKTNLFSRFRNLFRRSEQDYEDVYEEGYEEYSDVLVDETVTGEESFAEEPESVLQGDALQMPQGATAPESQPEGLGLQVPLAPIVSALPLELQNRLLQKVGHLSAFLPLERILPQLSKGSVSLTFGELREAAPKVFAGNRDQDASPVTIPLSAILPYISPDMLARKHGPLQVEIPEEIVSPFADKGKGLAIGSSKQNPMAPVAPAPALPTQSARPVPPVHQPIVPRSMPQATIRPMPRPLVQPAPAVRPPAPQLALPKPASSISAAYVRPAQARPLPTSAAPVTNNGTAILRKPGLAKVEAPASASAAPSVPAPVLDARPPLQVAISSVADGWPDAVKQEVIQLGLAQATLRIPYALVEAGLKRGRLTFPWSQLKSWLIPPAAPGVSLHDEVELELPLRVVAPLFIAQQKENGRQTTRVAVDKDIPNLFYGMPQPETAGVGVDRSVTKPMDTNYYIWDDRNDSVAEDAARAATAGTEFVTRYATPNEVVSRAAALDGIEGAVIALPDGLMVASKLAPGLNGDTLAAFLPHLFSKVTQCTQELRMGELNNLNFTVGNVPWKIFRVNALYFAAFGAKGQPLPTAQLAALAGELDHKAKA